MNLDKINFLTKEIPFSGNLSLTLVLTLGIFALTLILSRPLKYFICTLFKKMQGQTGWQNIIITHIAQPAGLMSVSFLWLMVLNFMPPLWKSLGGIPMFLSRPLMAGVLIAIKILIGSSLIWMIYNLVDPLTMHFIDQWAKKYQNSALQSHFMPFITRCIKAVVICLGSLLIMQNIGINVVSLMAGLGLGGVAIALAAKESFSNILAYLNIMLDKPFSVGDWIAFDHTEGTITEIGLRSCKLKTFYDSLVTIPNSVLVAAKIDNIGKRQSRRTRTYLGVQYNTTPEQLEQFIKGIKHILSHNSYVKKDSFQVYFTEFGSSDLKIILNFFLKVSDWETELEQKQTVFMEIIKLAKKLKVEFAFPTQTLHIDSLPPTDKKSK